MPSKEDKAALREIQQRAIEIARADGGLMIYLGVRVKRTGPEVCYTCIQCKRTEHRPAYPGVPNLRCPVCEPNAA
ncbi:MAG TPA: hypothetical protein VEA80_07630 [Vitreimonas sp.]|uniref:hypothetical protein n=1 Tax=Vitreimonas sp. TaxID=3069702 RepID=UPI002D6192BB|nr:hypothetical protein [Vitreimonas sp.]HYD87329.1 hypothetical protein [Vitreimonas sp.]